MDWKKTEDIIVRKMKRALSVILEYAEYSRLNRFERKSGQVKAMEAVHYRNGHNIIVWKGMSQTATISSKKSIPFPLRECWKGTSGCVGWYRS